MQKRLPEPDSERLSSILAATPGFDTRDAERAVGASKYRSQGQRYTPTGNRDRSRSVPDHRGGDASRERAGERSNAPRERWGQDLPGKGRGWAGPGGRTTRVGR